MDLRVLEHRTYRLGLLILAIVFMTMLSEMILKSLYSHGSSMVSTLEQVAAAFGIALMITVMSARAGQLIEEGVDASVALLNGMHWAFTVGAAIGVIAVIVTWMLPSRALR